jgi:pimeloyl-ACP methyl ester carboxylesterase
VDASVAAVPSAPFPVPLPGDVTLAGTRGGREGGPAVVLLHANVADRRSWRLVFDQLDRDAFDLVAYDRRGFGATPLGEEDFTHVEDLEAVLDAIEAERALLVGNSMGGAVALDLALTQPERVAGLVLLGAGATGMTDEGEELTYEPDPDSSRLLEALRRAEEREDVEERLRLLAHLWLDGPTSPEGRVGGGARQLFLEMNRRILAVGAPDEAGDSGLDTWHELGEIEAPGIAAWGDLDQPADLPWYRLMADRLPRVTGRVLPGVAHLPSVEQPQTVAALVREVAAGLGR